MKKIHATAVIDAKAEIGEDVEIGPYVVMGADVTIGSGTIVQSHAVFEGFVTIGCRNFIGPGCVIGAPPQDLGFSADRKTTVLIGNDNIIREHCTIHRGSADGTSTNIGNKNFLMVGAHLGHNCQIGNNVIIANNCLLAGYVRVDDQAFIGGGSTFHQNMRVGRLVMVQGSSAFGKDLPPFTMAAERNAVFGLNITGMRRAGFNAAQREDIKAAFRLLYLSGLNLSQALEKSATENFGELGREFFEFVAEAKKRSVCPYRGKKDREDAAKEI
ncbi:MAG: UDP-N-acetylglucosamine acyltransferase [Verrucomicrobiota bacterium]